MTETERKKITYQISLVLRVKPSSIYIERIETVSDKENKIFITCKGVPYGALMCGDLVLYTWRVVS
ncbi:MAG: hypothetical protein IJA89_08495 [Clostridia bacterium]|nr:hypothetical protein [Clostridia bacterium]